MGATITHDDFFDNVVSVHLHVIILSVNEMQYFERNGIVYLGVRDDGRKNGFLIDGHFYRYHHLPEYGFRPITSVQVERMK